GVGELAAVEDHLLEERLGEPERRAALVLQLGGGAVDDAPGVGREVQAEQLDLAGLAIDLDDCAGRRLVPVVRGLALSRLRIDADLGAEAAGSCEAREADHSEEFRHLQVDGLWGWRRRPPTLTLPRQGGGVAPCNSPLGRRSIASLGWRRGRGARLP